MKKVLLFCIMIFSLTSLTSFADDKSTENQYQDLVDLFFAAARIGNDEVVETFLANGFPIDERNNQSYTALMVATYNGQKSVVDLLLKSGANACLQDKRGNTALMGAVFKLEFGIAKTLYKAKCSDEIRNKAGLDLTEFAQMYGQSEVIKSLQQGATSSSN